MIENNLELLESLSLYIRENINTEELEKVYNYILELQEKGEYKPPFSAGDIVNFEEKHNGK